MKVRNFIHDTLIAWKAGWIVSCCKTGCRLDDENEEVISCVLHRAQLTALEAKQKGY